MDKLRKALNTLAGREALLLLTLLLGIFVLVERAGIYYMGLPSLREVLHGIPVIVISILLSIHALLAIAMRTQQGKRAFPGMMFYLGILVLVISLWASVVTRFEGYARYMEGGMHGGFPFNFDQQTLYMGSKARLPEVGMTLNRITPVGEADDETLSDLRIDMQYAGKWTSTIKNASISRFKPLYTDWTFITPSDFGYAIKYELKDLADNLLESNYVYLSTYPPGGDDFFETQFLGYVFHVKIYPDYYKKHGTHATRTLELINPRVDFRIVRNKDIVFSGLIKQGGGVKFDVVKIDISDIKKWGEMRFTRDLGYPVAAAGMFILLLSILWMAWQQRANKER